MRKLVLPILVLGLAALPLCGIAWAAGGNGDAAPAPAADKSTAQPSASLPDAPKPASTSAAAPGLAATPAVESELAELRALLHAQAAEIEAQRRELTALKAKMGEVKEEAVTAAVAAAVPAATGAIAPNGGTVLTGGNGKDEPITAIHFKGITLIPAGFTAAETVYRNRELSADINTPLNNINNLYAGSTASKISEFNLSGRQSRLALRMIGDVGSAKIGGYFEGDFLGAGVTSNNNESNSYVFRQRQFYGYVALNSGWYFSGGQMWSLMTEQRVGMENRTPSGGENANTPMTIDAQYTVGFSWARQYAFRVTDNFYDKKLSLGLSLEGAATRFTVSNPNNNFIFQAPGNTGGLYNPITSVGIGTAVCTTQNAAPPCTTSLIQAPGSQNYALNATPDFVFKAAIDPGWGHYEIFGVLRTFRSRFYPCGGGMSAATAALIAPAACAGPPVLAETALASNNTRAGGLGGFNLRAPFFTKKLDLGIHGLYGTGVGRYSTGSLSDATVRPNGQLAPINGGSWLASIEWHVTPKFDFYAYGGGEYLRRTFFAEPAGITATNFVGYGIPTINNSGCTSATEATPVSGGSAGSFPNSAGGCSGQARALTEGTIGFWHKIWKGEKGTVQWGLQYSYVSLLSWSGSTGAAAPAAQYHPSANDSMFFTSFRYYLP